MFEQEKVFSTKVTLNMTAVVKSLKHLKGIIDV